MVFLFGYNGKILRVNLTNGTLTDEKLEESFCRKYIGGSGFVAYYLMKEIKPKIDPLGPENKLFIMTGPSPVSPFRAPAATKSGASHPSPVASPNQRSAASSAPS